MWKIGVDVSLHSVSKQFNCSVFFTKNIVFMSKQCNPSLRDVMTESTVLVRNRFNVTPSRLRNRKLFQGRLLNRTRIRLQFCPYARQKFSDTFFACLDVFFCLFGCFFFACLDVFLPVWMFYLPVWMFYLPVWMF